MSQRDHTIPRPQDVTVVSILRDGRHLLFTTQAREGDDPSLLAHAHALVRRHNFDGYVERFVIVIGNRAETVEADHHG